MDTISLIQLFVKSFCVCLTIIKIGITSSTSIMDMTQCMLVVLCRGWGLRCLDDIPRGGFICIYAGQLLTDQGANEDGQQYGDEYLAELDYIEVTQHYLSVILANSTQPVSHLSH